MPSNADGDIWRIHDLIRDECMAVYQMLLDKNMRYGNSAITPLRIFSKADALEQIRVRIDDKLSRIAHQSPGREDEDVVMDLIGYLILLRVARRYHAKG